MPIELVQDRSDTADYPDSYYRATANRRLQLQPLEAGERADVCVIGGGYPKSRYPPHGPAQPPMRSNAKSLRSRKKYLKVFPG